jgi:hypothetical protein
MYQVTISGGDRPTVRYDFDALRLPSGELAHKLNPDELFRQLKALNCPDISAQSGKHDLLLACAKFLAAAKSGDSA